MFDVTAENTRTGRQICETAEDQDEAEVIARKIKSRQRPDGTPMYRNVHIDRRLFEVPAGEKQGKLF